MKKSKILTTADLFTKEKKPGKRPIITSLDLSDEDINSRTAEPGPEPKPISTTQGKENIKNEKEKS